MDGGVSGLREELPMLSFRIVVRQHVTEPTPEEVQHAVPLHHPVNAHADPAMGLRPGTSASPSETVA
ncbi:hypothetical protein [Streptomyces sp. NPDC058874]|uniref:hypothetical protein n=1 Tax=unclassified Streptomyces TaxID=2593676 RepID=UPI003690B001